MQAIADFFLTSHFFLSAAIVACAAILWALLKRLGRKRLHQALDASKLHGKQETYVRVSASIVKYLIAILTIVLVLQINGVNVSSLVTGLGIFSAVVGLALQDVLKDIIMGVNILEDDFFVVGDVVKYNDVEGTVIAFTVKTTKIQDIHTGSIFTVSNRNISQIEKISDWLDIQAPTAYEEDADRVRAVLEQVCQRIGTLPDVTGCRLLGTDEFADSAILYRLRIFCAPAQKPPVRRAALRLLQDAFTENRVTIPYRQLDVHNR